MNHQVDPFVSVVLCFYNEEKFLSDAVRSVLAQDHDNWELILVDDGSSDCSTNIAKRFADEYADRILYLEHPSHSNRGLSASRNLGIKKIIGDFVAFIDADDVWLPDKLSSQLKIFSRHPEVTVVLEASEYWRSWSGTGEHDIIIPIGVKEGTYSPPQLMLSLYPLGKGAAPCPSGIMVRKTVLRRCVFEENFRGIYQMYEDQAFLCKVYLKEKVYVSEACHNRYRQRLASLVSSVHHSGNYDIVRRFYLYWFRQYLRHQPVQHKGVENLVKRALDKYKMGWLKKLKTEVPRWAKSLIARIFVKLGILKYHKSW